MISGNNVILKHNLMSKQIFTFTNNHISTVQGNLLTYSYICIFPRKSDVLTLNWPMNK
jgi:hypothetical protein